MYWSLILNALQFALLLESLRSIMNQFGSCPLVQTTQPSLCEWLDASLRSRHKPLAVLVQDWGTTKKVMTAKSRSDILKQVHTSNT